MNEPQNNAAAERRCPKCGTELPADLPSGLCPKCLLKTGLENEPKAGPTGTVIVAPERLSPGHPQLGDMLGHYRIVRSLGAGGMGTVFEAEDLEDGRRVALKVLSQALDSPDARQRFFREGRLAASINHPNSVYIFGTEEIGGTPLIAMELVSGGTLEERVRSSGPMPAAEAVEAVLHIIAGLEAAQRTGIIHRDVKPSNCFVDPDGTVKIGDFGLSISTALRTEPALTAAGMFLGTPAFCSPEQLRGQELNARSDMYSVGATLFYLLTGHTPFEAKNVVALLATVIEQPAPSPRKFRPELPRGLSGVVRRCLEKQPGERFNSYDELRRALTPYASAATVPAAPRHRFVAGLLDCLILYLPGWCLISEFTNFDIDDIFSFPSRQTLAIFLVGGLGSLLYYALLEGLWGVTPGKLAMGLRVVGPNNNPPGFLRALLRASVYLLAPELPYWLICEIQHAAYSETSDALQGLMDGSSCLLTAFLFVTARRRNGFAALQDLLSKTRVIRKMTFEARPATAIAEASPAGVKDNRLIGPYHVLDTLEDSGGTVWLLGYDHRLLRKVWIRTVPSGTAPVPAPLRNLGRAGRLRWLAGRRSPDENWDAFEAPSGQPLLRLLDIGSSTNRQPWDQVRFWLYDLATELSAAQKDASSHLVLALDRVWISGDGHAKLLDFPAPGLSASSTGSISLSASAGKDASRFLDQVAAAALQGRAGAATKPASDTPVPLPLYVRQFFKELPQQPDPDALVLALRPLLQRVAVVTRGRRAAVMAFCLFFPFFMACGAFLFPSSAFDDSGLGVFGLIHLLHQRSTMPPAGKNQSLPTDHQYAIYIASHYRDVLDDPSFSTNGFFHNNVTDDERRFVQSSLAQNPSPTGQETAGADAAIGKIPTRTDFLDRLWRPTVAMTVLTFLLCTLVCPPALIAALAFRGGLALLVTDVTFVRRDGAPASRLRLLWRSMVAWIPAYLAFVVSFVLLAILTFGEGKLPYAIAFGLLAALAVLCLGLPLLSIALPKRGLQDRLAGTWPVPR